MTVVVTGASAGQGRAIALRLAAAGYRVRAISRNPGRLAEDLPTEIDCVAGDFTDGDGLITAMRGADTLVLTLPLVFDTDAFRTHGRNALAAAERAGVGRIVYNASVCAGDEPLGDAVLDTIGELVDAVASGPVPAAVLRPPLFLENLLAPWTRPDILTDGVLRYPLPADLAVRWLSQENLAAYVEALLDRGETGTVRDIADESPISGEDLGERLSQALGRPVAYEPLAPEAFTKRAGAVIGPEGGRHLADLYRILGTPDGRVFDRPYAANRWDLAPQLLDATQWMVRHLAESRTA